MQIEIEIPQSELSRFEVQIMQRVEAIKPRVQGAMAARFAEIVLSNFGIAGADRPWHFERLTPEYAKKVGREIATLEVTGALKASLLTGGSEGESTRVSMSNSSVPYALAHHDGSPEGNRSHPGLPARRVFPLDESDNVLPWTQSQVQEAAANELARMIL